MIIMDELASFFASTESYEYWYDLWCNLNAVVGVCAFLLFLYSWKKYEDAAPIKFNDRSHNYPIEESVSNASQTIVNVKVPKHGIHNHDDKDETGAEKDEFEFADLNANEENVEFEFADLNASKENWYDWWCSLTAVVGICAFLSFFIKFNDIIDQYPIEESVSNASQTIVNVKVPNHCVHNHDDKDETLAENVEFEFADLNVIEESVSSAVQTIVNVKVPKHVVGIIIGKHGSNIKKLRVELGVKFKFDRGDLPKNTTDNEHKRTYRILEIRGHRDNVRVAEYKVNAIIAETSKYVETEVFIPANTCGRIIGKGGQNVREMSSMSGAKINLERGENKSFGNRSRIRLSGTTVQVKYATLLIKEKVKQGRADKYKCSRKGDDAEGKTFNGLQHITLPSRGEYFHVYVSSYHAPNDFWVQLVSIESSKLDMLSKELADVYGKLKPEEERLECGKVGDICIAPLGGGMYRAVIRKINQDRTMELLYVDFGYVISITLDDIKEIRQGHKELYGQSVHCQLPIDPVGDVWTDEGRSAFEELTCYAQWKPLLCKVLYHVTTEDGQIPVLQLVNTTRNGDVDVAAMLLLKGYAQEV